jgi:hypothetical protein
MRPNELKRGIIRGTVDHASNHKDGNLYYNFNKYYGANYSDVEHHADRIGNAYQ